MATSYDVILNKSTADAINTAHISASPDLYEAARTGFFIFEPANESDAVLTNIAEKMKEFDSECQYDSAKIKELLRLNVTSSSVPHFTVSPLEYRRNNEVVKFAGVPSFSAGKIVIDDFVGIDTKSIMEAWLELAYNLKTRTGGRMSEYKMPCQLIEYTQDYRPVRTWHLSGCFVSGYSEDDFNAKSDGTRSLNATIEYDRATMIRGISGKASETNVIKG